MMRQIFHVSREGREKLQGPFTGALAVSRINYQQVRVQGMQFGHGPGCKSRGIILHFIRVEKIRVVGLDYQGRIAVGLEFGKLLMENRHPAEFGTDVVQCLAFHNGMDTLAFFQGIIADRQLFAGGQGIGKTPGIAFVGVNGDAEGALGIRGKFYLGFVLLKGLLRAPEYLFVFAVPGFILLGQKQEVAALVFGPVKHDCQALAEALERDDADALQFCDPGMAPPPADRRHCLSARASGPGPAGAATPCHPAG